MGFQAFSSIVPQLRKLDQGKRKGFAIHEFFQLFSSTLFGHLLNLRASIALEWAVFLVDRSFQRTWRGMPPAAVPPQVGALLRQKAARRLRATLLCPVRVHLLKWVCGRPDPKSVAPDFASFPPQRRARQAVRALLFASHADGGCRRPPTTCLGSEPPLGRSRYTSRYTIGDSVDCRLVRPSPRLDPEQR